MVLRWTIQTTDATPDLGDTGVTAIVGVGLHSTEAEEEDGIATMDVTLVETIAFIITEAARAATVVDETAIVDAIESRGITRGIGRGTDREIDRETDQGIGREKGREIEEGEDLVGIGTTGLHVLGRVEAAAVPAAAAIAGVEVIPGMHRKRGNPVTTPQTKIAVTRRGAASALVLPIRDPMLHLSLGVCVNVRAGNVLVAVAVVAEAGKVGKRSATTEAEAGHQACLRQRRSNNI